MAGEQRATGLSARSAAGPGRLGRSTPEEAPVPARPAVARPQRPAGAPVTAPGGRPAAAPPRALPASVAVPDSRVAYVSVVDASRRTGASVSAIRGWAREGQVRSRTGTGPRGDRMEVAVADVERLTGGAEPAPPPVRRSPRRRQDVAVAVVDAPEPDDAPGGQLVPLATVEAMERLSGELYLAGQRAARAEAVAELRDRRLADLQQEVDDLQREATGLWEQNQELLRRVAVAEAQVLALQGGQGSDAPRWRLRRG